MWDDKMRERMRRLDHSCIFILIGGTYTPIAMLALPEEIGREVLWVVWGGALLGVLRVHLWRRAPRFITIIPYLLLGWLAAFYLKHFLSALTPEQSWLFFGGGIPYSLGAIVYALKRPEPVPGVFGHHEVFHALTLVASACHFSAVMLMVRGHIS
jgi:hemolysin III